MIGYGGRRRRTRRGKGPGQAQVAGPAPAEARPTPPTTAAPVHVAVPAASAAVPEAPSPSDGVLRAQIAAGLSRLGRSAVSHDFMWNINDTVSQSPSKHPADGSGYRYDDMQQPMVSQACRCQVCGIHALIQPFHSGFAVGGAPGKTRSWRRERRDGGVAEPEAGVARDAAAAAGVFQTKACGGPDSRVGRGHG